MGLKNEERKLLIYCPFPSRGGENVGVRWIKKRETLEIKCVCFLSLKAE